MHKKANCSVTILNIAYLRVFYNRLNLNIVYDLFYIEIFYKNIYLFYLNILFIVNF